MILFILAVVVIFLTTGICALVEAALYAVRRPYIHRLVDSNHPAGKHLKNFKEKMDYPITAILIFDTLLGVGGAAIAGSQARALYGEAFVYWFTIGLAIMLLIFAQIIPKILGVVYNQSVARFSAVPIALAISILYPIVRAIEFLTRNLKPDEQPKQAIEEDVKQMAKISVEEGSILGIEGALIQNSLKLDDVRADQIMTTRDKVVSFPANMTVREACDQYKATSFSRIPVFEPKRSDNWRGVVLSRDILFAMANDRFDLRLGENRQKTLLCHRRHARSSFVGPVSQTPLAFVRGQRRLRKTRWRRFA